jgi:hypothetical protein
LDLHVAGRLPDRGFIRQEQVALRDFLSNRFGKYYESMPQDVAAKVGPAMARK